jgi:hypothetical protein
MGKIVRRDVERHLVEVKNLNFLNTWETRFVIFDGWRSRQTQKSQHIYFLTFAIFAAFCSKVLF